MKSIKTVDEYIADAPENVLDRLNELREAIRSVAPAAVERISYGMPYYHYKGRLAYFALAKNHIGVYALFPDEKEFGKELERYSTSKGTIRFPLKEKLPIALIKKLLRARLRKLEKAARDKKLRNLPRFLAVYPVSTVRS